MKVLPKRHGDNVPKVADAFEQLEQVLELIFMRYFRGTNPANARAATSNRYDASLEILIMTFVLTL
jgi:hypothetical protein